jgi:hypothetical protein
MELRVQDETPLIFIKSQLHFFLCQGIVYAK